MDVMAVVGVYLLFSAPMLGVLLLVHGLRSDYTNLLMAALFLQIIPIGLLFYPLGFIGVAMLGYTLWLAAERNRRFRRMGIDNVGVYRRWSTEYQANAVALGLAIEQKAVGLLFIEVAARHGFAMLWSLIPASVVLWFLVITLVRRERGYVRTLPPEEDAAPPLKQA
jgi:hypothetical protein